MPHRDVFVWMVFGAIFFSVFTGSALADDNRAPATFTVSPSSLSFARTSSGTIPPPQVLSVTAAASTRITIATAATFEGRTWASVSPKGVVTGSQKLTISVDPSGLAPGTYSGALTLTSRRSSYTVPIRLKVATSTTTTGASGYKIIGWNDLGMHCMDGKDYSLFAVLPPYNTIHAHLINPSGALVTNDVGYTITYQSIADPLTKTQNTTSTAKTNFWQYAAALGFGSLAPDTGLKGYKMPWAGNTPQAMHFSTADNTWVAEGVPVTPYADSAQGPYPVNYFPMMRLVARNSLGAVLATTDIVLPVSDEMTCSVCHSSTSGNSGAKPVSRGWANNPDAAKDVKYNILRKHDERFAATPLYQLAAVQTGYSKAGLEASTASAPVLCAKCHGSNALGLAGVSGVQPLTTAMHSLHASVEDPATGKTMDAATNRESCYRCHPGPNTKCLRGAMGTLKTPLGTNAIECQSCHGSMNTVATATRNGWLDEPSCQSCHTGTATRNSGQIAYVSVFTSGNLVREAADQTFATNTNTPGPGLSLYRFSKGHGGLQCEACHGSTHAEYTTSVANDNVQNAQLQGHAGTLSECTACHASTPNTVTGGPHGLHPIGAAWVERHGDMAERQGVAACQNCHGVDYRGTILSRMQADRTLAGRTFARGTIVGCYSCHNGPKGD